jgi:hypothetical protein
MNLQDSTLDIQVEPCDSIDRSLLEIRRESSILDLFFGNYLGDRTHQSG